MPCSGSLAAIVDQPLPEEVRMARYVDGYVLPVPRKNVEAYRRVALEYRECVKLWERVREQVTARR